MKSNTFLKLFLAIVLLPIHAYGAGYMDQLNLGILGLQRQASAPGNPLTGYDSCYLLDSNGKFYCKDALGNNFGVPYVSGATTLGDCVKFDANGNLVDAGGTCGVPGGTIWYQFIQANGVAQTQRLNLNFLSAFTITDDGVNGRTTVDLANGSVTNAKLVNTSMTVSGQICTLGTSCGLTSGSSILSGNGSGGFSNVTIGSGLSFAGGTLSSTGLANPMTTLGDLIYGAAAGAATRLAGQTTATKQYLSQTGTGTASAAPVWAQIAFGDISGTLPISQGGTGQMTATAAFNALSPMTTLGDTVYGGTAGAGTRLAGNTTTTKQYLSQTGTGTIAAAPVWAQIAFADLSGAASLTTQVSGILPVANGGTGANLSATGGASQVLKQVTAGAPVTVGQLACTDLSGVAASCSTDATNATNISSGTLAAARLPAPSSGAFTTNIDWSVGKNIDYLYTLTLSANTTLTWSNLTAGETIVMAITNTASNWTVTWPATAHWPAATAPVQTVGAKTDVYTCKAYSGTDAYCSVVQNY